MINYLVAEKSYIFSNALEKLFVVTEEHEYGNATSDNNNSNLLPIGMQICLANYAFAILFDLSQKGKI